MEKKGLLSLLVYAHFTNDIYNFILPPLLVVMRYEFETSYFEGGILVALYLLTSGVMQTPIARFAERRGLQRHVMVAGFLGMALSMLLLAFSRSFPEFVADSFILGLSLAPYHPQGIGAVSMAFDAKERGTAVGIHQLGGNVGMFTAPLIVAALFSSMKMGWRAALVAMAAPAIFAALLLSMLFDLPTRGVVENKQEKGRERGASSPMFTPIVLLAIAYAFNAISTRAFSSFTPSYLNSVTSNVGLSEVLSSAVIASGIVAFPLGGFMSDRLGRKQVIWIAYGLAGLFFMIYSLLGGVIALPALFFAFFFGYVGSAPALAFASELGRDGRANSSVALVFGAGTVGNAAGPFIVGPLIDALGFLPSFEVISVFAILAAVPVLMIRVSGKTSSGTETSDQRSNSFELNWKGTALI
ncbi:MAG: MFS transporter [Thermoprotei archaeon]